MNAIRAYEQSLSLELLRVLKENGAHIYGIDAENRIAERVPTVCFNLPGKLPQEVTETAARAGIGIRDGHMYAPRLMQRMGAGQRDRHGPGLTGALQYVRGNTPLCERVGGTQTRLACRGGLSLRGRLSAES